MNSKKRILNAVCQIFIFFTLFLYSCDSWMENDNFFKDIEDEVKVANAPEVSIYIRYTSTDFGTTTPQFSTTQKVGVPFSVIATTDKSYGFYKWAAFSKDFFDYSTESLNSKDSYGKVKAVSTKTLLFVDTESYKLNFEPYELTSADIKISDAKNSSTTVTILTERNDIVLVAVSAKRPDVVDINTFPSNNKTDVIRNQRITIAFDKQMDLSSFCNVNENGEALDWSESLKKNVLIQSFDTTEEVYKDAYEYFNPPQISTNKRKLIISCKSAIPRRTQIIVTIDRNVTDIYGYAMEDQYQLGYTTGADTDNYAPIFTELELGINGSYNSFSGYMDDEKNITNILFDKSSSTEINDWKTNASSINQFLTHRVGKYVNIHVNIKDITSDSDTGANSTNDDIDQFTVSCIPLVSKDGNAGLAKEFSSSRKSIIGKYMDQVNDCDSSIDNIVANIKFVEGENVIEHGYAFTYEFPDDLPDGLIRMNFSASDSVGNDGSANPYVIYVVKDTSCPILDEANLNKITYSSTNVISNWYNNKTLGNLTFKVSSGPILDDCCDLLQPFADDTDQKMYWQFGLGDQNNFTINDSAWKEIDQTGNTQYSLNSDSWNKDGLLYTWICLKDDLGNISIPVKIESNSYFDNTSPKKCEVTSLSDAMSSEEGLYVYSSNGALQLSLNALDKNLEGLVNDTECSNIAGYIIKETDSYTMDELSNVFTINNNNITNVSNGVWIPASDNISNYSFSKNKIYYVYTVDKALNISDFTKIQIIEDNNKPIVNSITVNNSIKVTATDGVTQDSEKNWCISNDINNKLVTLCLDFNEEGSGIKEIIFEDNINFTDSTKLTDEKGDQLFVDSKAIVYTINSDEKKISLSTALFKTAKIYITNLQLTYSGEVKNNINVSIKDFAGLESDKANTTIYKESTRPIIFSSLYNKNLSIISSTNKAEPNYLNNNKTNTILIPFKEINSSGISKITTNSRITFSSDSKVYLHYYEEGNWIKCPNPQATQIINNHIINLTNPIKGKNNYLFEITNINIVDNGESLLTKDEANIKVGIQLTSVSGMNDGQNEASINDNQMNPVSFNIDFDKTQPILDVNGPKMITNEIKVYPRNNSYGIELENKSIFYVNSVNCEISTTVTDNNIQTVKYFSNSNSDTVFTDGFDSVMDTDITSLCTFENVTCSTNDYYLFAYDKAGNVSEPVIFRVIEDDIPVVNNGSNYVTDDVKYYDTYSNFPNLTQPEYHVFVSPVLTSYTLDSITYPKCSIVLYHNHDNGPQKRATIEIPLPDWTVNKYKDNTSSSGIQAYAISNTNESTQLFNSPTNISQSLTAWNQWIVYDPSSPTIKVYPLLNEDTGIIYLYLMNKSGKIQTIQIRNKQHRENGIVDVFIRDAGRKNKFTNFEIDTKIDNGNKIANNPRMKYITTNKIFINENMTSTIGFADDHCLGDNSIRYYFYSNTNNTKPSRETIFNYLNTNNKQLKSYNNTSLIENEENIVFDKFDEITFSEIVNGTYLFLYEEDGVGNFTIQNIMPNGFPVYVDKTKPKLEIIYKSSNEHEIKNNSSVINPGEVISSDQSLNTLDDSISVEIKASDSVSVSDSGVKSIKINDIEIDPESLSNQTLEPGESTITVTDNVGNSTSFNINLVKVSSPNCTITNTTANIYGTSYYYNKNDSLTISNLASGSTDKNITYGFTTDTSTLPINTSTITEGSTIVSFLSQIDGTSNALYLYLSNGFFTRYIPIKEGITSYVYDITPPSPPVSITVDENSKGFVNGSTLYFGGNTCMIKPFSNNTDILGYSLSSEGTNCSISLTVESGNINIYSVDKAGNVSNGSLSLTLQKDNTGPSVNNVASSKPPYIYSNVNYYNEATLSVTISDQTGISAYMLSSEDECPAEGWITTDNSKEITKDINLPNIELEGLSIYLYTKDILDNIKKTEVKYNDSSLWTHDNIAPTWNNFSIANSNSVYLKEETIFYKDQNSKFEPQLSSINDKNPLGFCTDPGSVSFNQEISITSLPKINLYAVDKAHNFSETKEISLIKDSDLPQISVEVNNIGEINMWDSSKNKLSNSQLVESPIYYIGNDSISVKINASDSGSGVKSIKINEIEIDPEVLSNQTLDPGESTVTVTDNVGNSTSFKINLEKVYAPTCTITNTTANIYDTSYYYNQNDSLTISYLTSGSTDKNITYGFTTDTSTLPVNTSTITVGSTTVSFLDQGDETSNALYLYLSNGFFTIYIPIKEGITSYVYDATPPMPPESITVNQQYIYINENDLFYQNNANKENVELTPVSSDLDIIGYSLSNAGTDYSDSLNVKLENSNINIYSVDKTGNVSTCFTLNVTKDEETSTKIVTSDNLQIVKDYSNYKINYYENYNVEIDNTEISSYAFSTSDGNKSLITTWNDANEKIINNKYEFPLPTDDVFSPKEVNGVDIYLYMKFENGKIISNKLVTNNNNSQVGWFHHYNKVTNLTYNKDNTSITIQGLTLDHPIKSIKYEPSYTINEIQCKISNSSDGNKKIFTTPTITKTDSTITFTDPIICYEEIKLTVNETFQKLIEITDIFNNTYSFSNSQPQSSDNLVRRISSFSSELSRSSSLPSITKIINKYNPMEVIEIPPEVIETTPVKESNSYKTKIVDETNIKETTSSFISSAREKNKKNEIRTINIPQSNNKVETDQHMESQKMVVSKSENTTEIKSKIINWESIKDKYSVEELETKKSFIYSNAFIIKLLLISISLIISGGVIFVILTKNKKIKI